MKILKYMLSNNVIYKNENLLYSFLTHKDLYTIYELLKIQITTTNE